MLNQNQQTVYDWINNDLELPVYAEAYKGAVEQLNNRSSGYITFVSHAGRDLMNGLASDAEDIPRDRVDYVYLVNEFQNDWEKKWGRKGYDTTEDIKEEAHLIPIEICEKIKDLVDKHKEGRLRAEGKISLLFTTFLDYPNQEIIPEYRIKTWQEAKKFFEKHAHLRKKGFSPDAPIKLELHFKNLDSFLYEAATNVIRPLRSIHEILEETNQ